MADWWIFQIITGPFLPKIHNPHWVKRLCNPCVYLLLPNKTEKNLFLNFEMLCEETNAKPDRYLADFEKAALNAFSKNFRDANISCCYFHLKCGVLDFKHISHAPNQTYGCFYRIWLKIQKCRKLNTFKRRLELFVPSAPVMKKSKTDARHTKRLQFWERLASFASSRQL